MLSPAWVADQPGVIDLENSIYIDWGAFISSIINFLLIAFVLFMIVRTMNRIAEAQERMVDGLDLDEKKEIFQIRNHCICIQRSPVPFGSHGFHADQLQLLWNIRVDLSGR